MDPHKETNLIQVVDSANFIGVLDMYNSLTIVLKFEEIWENNLKQLPIG